MQKVTGIFFKIKILPTKFSLCPVGQSGWKGNPCGIGFADTRSAGKVSAKC